MKKRRKFTKKEIIALVVLVALMIGVAVAGAIVIVGNVNSANREATNTAHTTIKLPTPAPTESAKDGVTEKIIEKKTSKKSEKKNTSVEASEKATTNSTASKNTPSKTSKKTKSTTSKTSANKISVVVPEENTKHKSSEKCVINGVTCYVGDTISVTLNLTAPKVAINYQGNTDYDSEYLSCVSVKSNTSGLVNDKDSQILYVASDLSGLDFTSKGTIYTAKFKVKKAGSTSLKNNLEVLSDMDLKEINLSSCKIEIAVYK